MKKTGTKEFFEQRARERQSLADKLGIVFAHEHQAVLELGCGHGHFLTSLSLADPTKLHIGIDKLPSRITRAQRKAERAAQKQLLFIQADIQDFLELTPAEVRWNDIYILFPDPWPKNRHLKHRWLRASTLEVLAQQSLASTRLYFRTDVKSFFEDMLKLLAHQSQWQIIAAAPWPTAPPTVFERYATAHYSFIAGLIPSPTTSC